jgi:hypothetical protein
MTSSGNFAELPIPHPSSLPSAEDVRFNKFIINHLDQEIDALKGRIYVLNLQLRNLQEKRANHASYIAPLRRLPNETLRDIVEICWEDGMDMAILLQTSARIRQVVLGFSKAWSKIRISDKRSHEQRHTIQVNSFTIGI